MRCIIPGRRVRAFGKAIYCLAKIGEELYIEALPVGLALKTVNGARSAFASFIFYRTFFHLYRYVRRSTNQDIADSNESEEASLKCKISIKSCVSVFKALSTLEKTVDRCTFYLDYQKNKLVFVFHCRHGIVKTHNLGFHECEALQAVFIKDLCPNQITGPAKIISEVMVNFPNNLDEVTLITDTESIRLKNYVENDDDSSRVSLIEISLTPEEFDNYQIGVDTAITFCLKELRALLMFTDAINHSLSIKFEGPGRPVVFSLDDCDDYQTDFVLATLLESSPSSLPTTATIDLKITSPDQRRDLSPKRAQNVHQHISFDSTDIDRESLETSVSIEHSHCIRKLPQEFSQFDSAKVQGSIKSLAYISPTLAPHPMDTDYIVHMDPSSPRPLGVMNLAGGVGRKDRSPRITASTTTEELMDALFSVEKNTRDQRVISNNQDQPDCSEALTKYHTTDGDDTQEAVSVLPGKVTNDVQPLSTCTSAKVSLSCDPDLHSTQGSIINDSEFLPSTPPSKKFKRGSVFLEVGLFGNGQSRTQVLALDSEEDSD